MIIEYKRALNENVISQGLYYLDWLMDHKAEFTLLVMKKLGADASDAIEWGSPRLLCIAGDFTKYDAYAVQQIPRNINLLRYRRYGDKLLLLELVNASVGTEAAPDVPSAVPFEREKSHYKGFLDLLPLCSSELRKLWEDLRSFLVAIGDDVEEKQLKYYVAFRRLKNFACVEVHPQSGEILIYTKIDPTTLALQEGFTRDVTNVGHYGTGDLEIRVRNAGDLERAKPILMIAYENG